MANPTRKIRLTRSIIVAGKHADKGEVHECPAPLAHMLVGEGSAEFVGADAEQVSSDNKLGVAVHSPKNDDPQPRKVSDAAPQPKAKKA